MPDKYQDEIEEILRKAGEVVPSDPSSDSPRELARIDDDGSSSVRATRQVPADGQGHRRRWPRVSPGKLLLAGLIVFAVAAIARITPMIWVGLGMLVVAYLLFFVTPRSISHEKRWRGRSVEEYRSGWERIKRWLRN